MIDKDASVSLAKQCQLLGLSRSSVYYQPALVADKDLAVMRVLDEVHLARPFLGSLILPR